jgi:hypothetical protein
MKTIYSILGSLFIIGLPKLARRCRRRQLGVPPNSAVHPTRAAKGSRIRSVARARRTPRASSNGESS